MAIAESQTDLLALIEQAFSSMEEVGSQLAPDEWNLPTDCPGWTVKDQFSHVSSYEAVAAGLAPPATTDVSHIGYVKAGDPFSGPNEREIEARRGLPGAAVLDEFRAATAARMKHLASLDEGGWAADRTTYPWGEVGTMDSLPIRILDVFYHEQDVRRATGKPGHLDGGVARHSFAVLSRALPRIVAKLAQAPEGSVVVFEVGSPGRTIAVETKDGRGAEVQAPAAPDVRLRMDGESFFCVAGGRWTPERARTEGRLVADGDEALAGRVLSNIVVLP